MPEMDYSLIHRTPDGNGKILVTTPGSPDKGSWETEAELKTYVNQDVVKQTDIVQSLGQQIDKVPSNKAVDDAINAINGTDMSSAFSIDDGRLVCDYIKCTKYSDGKVEMFATGHFGKTLAEYQEVVIDLWSPLRTESVCGTCITWSRTDATKSGTYVKIWSDYFDNNQRIRIAHGGATTDKAFSFHLWWYVSS